jgi:hypothetical protein
MKQQQQEDNQEENNQQGGGGQGRNLINQGGVADQQGDNNQGGNNQGHNNPSVAGNTIPNNNANTDTQKTVAGNGPAPAGGNNTMENMGVNPPNVDPIKKPPVIENNNKLN